MSEPHPTYRTTTSTYPDTEITPASVYSELVQARAAIIQAGKALERAMCLPIEERAVMTRAERRELLHE
jgi:hypothetical protein